jgi:ATP-dependent RNA helicase RhlE
VGAEGVAISLCDVEEASFLRDIEKLIRMTIPVSDRRANQRWAEPPPAASEKGPAGEGIPSCSARELTARFS